MRKLLWASDKMGISTLLATDIFFVGFISQIKSYCDHFRVEPNIDTDYKMG